MTEQSPRRESLFDNKLTIVDVFKFLILLYTGYATFTLVQGISTMGSLWGTIRPFAAVAFVEGGLLIFEYMFAKAKNKEQLKTAQLGYILSIVLIVTLAVSSLVIEMSKSLLSSTVLIDGFKMTARDLGEVGAGVFVAVWVGVCLVLRLKYQTQDPDEQFEREMRLAEGMILDERNRAWRETANSLKGVFAIAKSLEELEKRLSSFSPADRDRIRARAQRTLDDFYGSEKKVLPPPVVTADKMVAKAPAVVEAPKNGGVKIDA